MYFAHKRNSAYKFSYYIFVEIKGHLNKLDEVAYIDELKAIEKAKELSCKKNNQGINFYVLPSVSQINEKVSWTKVK